MTESSEIQWLKQRQGRRGNERAPGNNLDMDPFDRGGGSCLKVG